jgi:hypothetical protein
MRLFLKIGAIAFSLAVSVPSKATTYNVDIFGPLPDGVIAGPTGLASTNACSATTCAGGFNTALSFQVQPGDTINFGTLSLGSFIFGDGRQLQPTQYIDQNGQLQSAGGVLTAAYLGSLGVAFFYTGFIQLNYNFVSLCNTGNPACLGTLQNVLATYPPQQRDLNFTLPDGFIELGWTRPYVYTPPDFVGIASVPESSTWAMLLIGFAGIGFVAYSGGAPFTSYQIPKARFVRKL